MTRTASDAQSGPWCLPREPLRALEPGLDSAWYHDPAHHARELEVFWYGMWIAAGREEEWPAPRDYRVVAVGSQSILVLRDAGGALRAFHNTCSHRGSLLCVEESGRLGSDRIVCPYHAWTYSLDGRLVGTPRQMAVEGFDRVEHSLHEVAIDTWGGFVFIHLAGEAAPPLAGALADIPERFERHGLAGLRIGRRIVLDVRANWKLLVENFSECFHCPPVHPEFCAIVPAYGEAGAWGLGGTASQPEYLPGARTLTLDGSARLPPLRGLNDADRATLYAAQTFPPNLFLNVHPDYVNAQMMFPTGPESVRMVYDWLFEADRLPMPEADLEHYVRLWDLTNRQDARNCEWQQRGLQARTFAHGSYVPQEFDCHRFDQWVRRALG
jgi:Rieske 2Fe-2S family protein